MNLPNLPVRPFSLANRRRHSRWNRWLLAVVVVCAVVAGCGPGVVTVPPRARPAPAAVQKSAVPTLEEVRRMNGVADQHGASAAGKVSGAKSGLVGAQAELQSLAGEVDRLHRQKSATENELLALYNRLVAQERKFAVMVSDLAAAENDLAAERALRLQAGKELVAAQALATLKDAEAAQLRGQLAHSESVADALAAAADTAVRMAASHAARADRAAGTVRTLRRLLAGVLVVCLVSVAFNVVQFKGGLL